MWNLLFLILLFTASSNAYLDHPYEKDDPRKPSNVRMRAGEQWIEVHWDPPLDAASANFCMVEYQRDAFRQLALPVKVPVGKDTREYTLTGLDRKTTYKIRLYCFYGNNRGPTRGYIYASTRTASIGENICPGSLPNAFLEQVCIFRPNYDFCEFTCIDGYKISKIPNVLQGGYVDFYSVECRNGTWITRYEDSGFELQDICIPEALDDKCPKAIPNGVLERYCGHATDWLCDFECNGGYNYTTDLSYGYHLHILMRGKLKDFRNRPEKLFCDNGTWKTGYERLGLDVSQVCVHIEDHICTDPIPNVKYNNTSVYMYPNGVSTMTGCANGYHKHALASDDKPLCESGTWFLLTSKYDPHITPQTLCVADDAQNTCSRSIPNGQIPQGCLVGCTPVCNDGYHVHGASDHFQEVYDRVTCESGKWLTSSKPYNGDNICFPNGGMRCSSDFPNGMVTDRDFYVVDKERQRHYSKYKCNTGFRPHYGVRFIECVAGKLVTWNERFGINTSTICVPFSGTRHSTTR